MCSGIAYLVVGWAVAGRARTVPGTRPWAGRALSARRLGMTLACWTLPLKTYTVIKIISLFLNGFTAFSLSFYLLVDCY